MKTTLEVCLERLGWNIKASLGQVKQAYATITLKEQDHICNGLMMSIGAKELSDVENAAYFFRKRTEHFVFKGIASNHFTSV